MLSITPDLIRTIKVPWMADIRGRGVTGLEVSFVLRSEPVNHRRRHGSLQRFEPRLHAALTSFSVLCSFLFLPVAAEKSTAMLGFCHCRVALMDSAQLCFTNFMRNTKLCLVRDREGQRNFRRIAEQLSSGSHLFVQALLQHVSHRLIAAAIVAPSFVP